MERCEFWKNNNISAGLQYVLVLLDRSWQVRTCPKSEFWSKFACCGSKTEFLMKFLDDPAWLCLEKQKKHTNFLDSSTQNHAEPFWNYLEKSVLDPKRAKLDQNSDFGHVRTRQGQSRRTGPCQQSRLLFSSQKLHPSLFH